MDALKETIAQEIYRVIDETIQHRLARMEPCAGIEIIAVTDLITQIKVWPRPIDSGPRYFNVQIKELM